MSTIDLPTVVTTTGAQTGETILLESHRHDSFFTIEHGAYLLLGIVSLIAHLWGLGDRALHHDEVLHATYSWYIYVGRSYIHDPLLHGPFLYYFGALIYFLFGDTDFTARLGAGLFGTVLTLLPFLVRRELGRPAALMAAVYLLISPVVLYVGRFIRHDIYAMVFEVLVFVAIVRYGSTRQARWLYIGIAAFALMVANLETSYLFLLIMGTPLLLLFLWHLYKPGIAILGGLAVALAALVFVLPGHAEVDGSHTAIRNQETGLMNYTPGPIFGWYPLETSDNAYALRIRNRADNDGGRSLAANIGIYFADLWRFFGHPAILIGIVLFLGISGLLLWLIWWRLDSDGKSAWQRAREQGDPVIEVYASLAADQRWLVALAIFFLIYTLLFTAFLTNLLGIVTGTTGSLLYWLAQHNVERGGQPGYYYLVILFIYEPLVILWTIIATVLIVKEGIMRFRQARASKQPFVRDGFLTPLLLLWWSLGALGIYSWAGEKMPWLTIHIVVPLIFLGAWAAQQICMGSWLQLAAPSDAELPVNVPRSYRPHLLFFCLFTAITGFGFVLMTTFIGVKMRIELPAWMVLLLLLMLFGLLVAMAGLRWGWRWSLGMLAISITLIGSVYTMRNAYRLSFLSGDVPREMMIYTQTTPDVMHVVRQLEEASRRRGGGLDIPIMYDNETVWLWYFRNFRAASNTGPNLSGPPAPEIQAVFMLQENISRNPQIREHLQDFRMQRLPLRWWFPEDSMYRLRDNWRTGPIENVSLLGRVLREPFGDETIVQLWQFLMFREIGVPLGSTDFVVAVRPLLADQIGFGVGAELVPEQ